MSRRGAGGTDGGTATFLIGLGMMVAGGYLLLRGIVVRPMHFGFGTVAFRFGGLPITSGMILVPFIFGVGMIFYNGRSIFGWALAAGALLSLVVGVITSINLTMAHMSAFDLLVILILLVGGLGLFLRSLRDQSVRR